MAIKVLFILGCGATCDNKLYDGGRSPHTADGRAGFANFTVAAAKHYAELYPGGVAFELWNGEPPLLPTHNVRAWRVHPGARTPPCLCQCQGASCPACMRLTRWFMRAEPMNSWTDPRPGTLTPPNDGDLPPFNHLAIETGAALRARAPGTTSHGRWGH
jgi:hypothetical protein